MGMMNRRLLFFASCAIFLVLVNLTDRAQGFGPGMKSQFGRKRSSMLERFEDGSQQQEDEGAVCDYACDTTSRDYNARDISCMQCKRLVRIVKRVLVAQK